MVVVVVRKDIGIVMVGKNEIGQGIKRESNVWVN